MTSSAHIGATFGHYRILEQVGAGGMGEVFRAYDERLEREVALKFVSAARLADEGARKRFRREALILSRLNHPNLATIYDFDSQAGVDFLVMELVPGMSLSAMLAAGPLAENDTLHLGLQLADGVAAAHAQGVIHRDLKPGNLHITPDNRLKILDFGLAKLYESASPTASAECLTDPLAACGTVPYASPEQLLGEIVDVRTDVYAMGAVLYEMTTGRRPFTAVPSWRLSNDILYRIPDPPRALNAQLSPELERIVLRCLEKQPDHRYQSARELEEALKRLRSPSQSNISQVRRARRRHPGKKRICSLAVLPLVNLGGSDDDYFADGMTEALIANLAQIGALRVISRTSVMRYKGTDKSAPQIARELEVDGLVEGSTLRAGNRVRITAELIHAPTDTHLWAKIYERDFNNVLKLQRKVAQAIADEIQIRLTPKERQRLTGGRPINPEAYEAYLKGRYYWNKRTGPDIRRAIQYFEQAVAIDPNYAAAYAGLSDAYHVLWVYTGVAPTEVYLKAKTSALKALEIDSSLAEARTSLAAIKADDDWDFAGAESEFRRAIVLNPNYPTAHQWFAQYLAYVGRFDEAIAEAQKAQKLDPLSPIIHTVSGDTYLRARQYDRAIVELQKAIEIDPNFSLAHSKLRDAYLGKGQFPEAMAEGRTAAVLAASNREQAVQSATELEEAYLRSGEDGYWRKRLELAMAAKERPDMVGYDDSSYCIASICARIGEKDQAFLWLERAVEEREVSVVYFRTAPEFDDLRSDLRAAELVRRMGL